RRDPLPSDNLVDFELLKKLNNNLSVIRRYPETFLYLVGLSRSSDDLHVRLTLLKSDESGGFWLVKTEERILVEDHTIANELEEHAGKKKRKVVFNAPPPGVKKASMRVL
ncbi:hypothetical protein Tco_0284098, partial [Tanacetum coccineum]